MVAIRKVNFIYDEIEYTAEVKVTSHLERAKYGYERFIDEAKVLSISSGLVEVNRTDELCDCALSWID